MGSSESAPLSGESAGDFVQRVTREYPIVVFSKLHCPFCWKAKYALSRTGANYLTIELTGCAGAVFVGVLRFHGRVKGIFVIESA